MYVWSLQLRAPHHVQQPPGDNCSVINPGEAHLRLCAAKGERRERSRGEARTSGGRVALVGAERELSRVRLLIPCPLGQKPRRVFAARDKLTLRGWAQSLVQLRQFEERTVQLRSPAARS